MKTLCSFLLLATISSAHAVYIDCGRETDLLKLNREHNLTFRIMSSYTIPMGQVKSQVKVDEYFAKVRPGTADWLKISTDILAYDIDETIDRRIKIGQDYVYSRGSLGNNNPIGRFSDGKGFILDLPSNHLIGMNFNNLGNDDISPELILAASGQIQIICERPTVDIVKRALEPDCDV